MPQSLCYRTRASGSISQTQWRVSPKILMDSCNLSLMWNFPPKSNSLIRLNDLNTTSYLIDNTNYWYSWFLSTHILPLVSVCTINPTRRYYQDQSRLHRGIPSPLTSKSHRSNTPSYTIYMSTSFALTNVNSKHTGCKWLAILTPLWPWTIVRDTLYQPRASCLV